MVFHFEKDSGVIISLSNVLVPAKVQGALPVTAVMCSSTKHGPPTVRHLPLSHLNKHLLFKKKLNSFLCLSN